MALRLPVKIGNITHLSDARYGAGMGADYLGFPVESGISLTKFKDIAGWIAGPTLVVELADFTADWRNELPGVVYQINVTQLTSITAESKWIVAGTGAQLLDALPKLMAAAAHVLFLEVSDASELTEHERNTLMGHFPLWAQIADATAIPWVLERGFSGISLLGFEEERTGLKAYGALAEILEALEVD